MEDKVLLERNDKVLFQFNTGRKYTMTGQLVQCMYYPDGRVIHFFDRSRGVCGSILAPNRHCCTELYVMRMYDLGQYQERSPSDAPFVELVRRFTELEEAAA